MNEVLGTYRLNWAKVNKRELPLVNEHQYLAFNGPMFRPLEDQTSAGIHKRITITVCRSQSVQIGQSCHTIIDCVYNNDANQDYSHVIPD